MCHHHNVILAHSGHWVTSVAYFLPVVAFLTWLGVTQIRERRSSRAAAHLE